MHREGMCEVTGGIRLSLAGLAESISRQPGGRCRKQASWGTGGPHTGDVCGQEILMRGSIYRQLSAEHIALHVCDIQS